MNKSYNRFKIDNTLSMGENGFLYYNDIIKKNSFNRIIISSIFNLYKKNCIQVDTNKKNELIIKVLSIKENCFNLDYDDNFIELLNSIVYPNSFYIMDYIFF